MSDVWHPDSSYFYTTLTPVSPGIFPPGEDTVLYNMNSNNRMTAVWLSLTKSDVIIYSHTAWRTTQLNTFQKETIKTCFIHGDEESSVYSRDKHKLNKWMYSMKTES